jgi:hypothetical protein
MAIMFPKRLFIRCIKLILIDFFIQRKVDATEPDGLVQISSG